MNLSKFCRNIYRIKNSQTTFSSFYHPDSFSTKDILEGNTHIRHEMYSFPYTWVLAFSACRVKSDRLDIGAGESFWSDIKIINNTKRSNLNGESLDKCAIFYTSAYLKTRI